MKKKGTDEESNKREKQMRQRRNGEEKEKVKRGRI